MTPPIDLYAIPFATLVARLERELAGAGSVYQVPRRDWWTPDPDRDISITHLGQRVATPLGPASGPHTQLAQNIVAAYLAGARFMELKTVQINDELVIPRPCIHAPHLGYNVEWSQELRVHQSAREYAKAWLLVHMLASAQGPGLWPGAGAVFDLSLGYDLAGVESDKIRNFVSSLRQAKELLDELRAELPASLGRWREVPCPETVVDSVTLSTFHGCPAAEIESIAAQTLGWGLHTVIKLNPTLYGHDRVRALLDRGGYDFVSLDPAAFEKDLDWAALLDMLPRLRARAAARGLELGVKFSNTLVMSSPEPPFEAGEMYLSGPPLHMIALALASELRAATDPALAITFSAGVDQHNFADCVAAGLQPVTVCTDLLKTRGYARLSRYLRALELRMAEAGAASVEDLRRDASDDALRELAARVAADPRYHRARNHKLPRKVGSELALLDCLSCDKCIPVCPNLANFAIHVPTGEHDPGAVSWRDGELTLRPGEALVIAKSHQIGNTAEACNLCGNCDTWCPEDGGPHLAKPNLFISRRAFDEHPERDGFCLAEDRSAITWRRAGQLYTYTPGDPLATLELDGGRLELRGDVPESGEGRGELDLRVVVTMRLFLDALSSPSADTWLAPIPD